MRLAMLLMFSRDNLLAKSDRDEGGGWTRRLVPKLSSCRRHIIRLLTAGLLCSVASAIQPSRAAGSAADVDAVRIGDADRDGANWLSYGRTYSEQRFSPLTKIT